jgi:hypothetical protein
MTGLPPPRSRTNSLASTPTTESQHNAALLGAVKAFGRPPPSPRAPSNADNRANGALVAANSVGAGAGSKTPSPNHKPNRPPNAAPSPPMDTFGSVASTGKEGMSLTRAKMPHLALPAASQQHGEKERATSPSHQAAKAAAARAPEPQNTSPTRPRARTTQRPTVAPKPRRLSEHLKNDREEQRPDRSSIPPTSSLVDLFERRTSDHPGKNDDSRPGHIIIKQSRDLPVKSPKPMRKADSGITSMFQLELDQKPQKAAAKPTPSVEVKDHDVAVRVSSIPIPSLLRRYKRREVALVRYRARLHLRCSGSHLA